MLNDIFSKNIELFLKQGCLRYVPFTRALINLVFKAV